MRKEIPMEWTKEWPTQQGLYWMYSYRYGKISCGTPCKPELVLINVREINNGTMITGNGQFVYKSEPEEAHFKPAELPLPYPEI